MRLRDWITLAPVFFRCIGKLPASHLWYLARQFRSEHPHRHRGRLYVNSFFPPYPSRPFARFLDAVINRRRVPYSTYVAVTDACPYHCPHCSYGRHQKGSLGTGQALEIIRQTKSLGTITIGFTGGEPLLRDDIVELVESVGDEVATILFTTGHRLTSDLAGRLRQAGLDCLMIGIESDEAGEHDAVRGVAGSFDEAMAAISLSREAGLYTALSTVATKEKIKNGQVLRLARLAQRRGVQEFRVLEPVPTGNLYANAEQVLSPAESRELAEFHKEWNRKNRGPAISGFSYLESDEMFGCGAGFHHLFIDAVGNVCPCDLTPLSFGNVLDEPLEEIWLKMDEWFDLPRCGCLMKEICTQIADLAKGRKFPLDRQASMNVCNSLERPGCLPRVYQNLFKGRRPADRPGTRR
ncbi:MAG: radical SAM protein [Sedimentisphaerales bacterium]|nr:radical SAM protein [Sedimentisphaerales bacterium]